MILNIIFSVVLIGKFFRAQLVKSEGIYINSNACLCTCQGPNMAY